ncbi:MAG TPA: hypothetical protein VFV65_06075 [Gemmatimonadales bacterium]|nr:hypothetical protein [Gemmatimonadales bacterium]
MQWRLVTLLAVVAAAGCRGNEEAPPPVADSAAGRDSMARDSLGAPDTSRAAGDTIMVRDTARIP